MLAVAFAHELSQANKTLILDLDFFNRGLTGLLRSGRKVSVVKKPGFLETDDGADRGGCWELVEVAANIQHLRYPDLSDEEIRLLETQTVEEISQGLCEYLRYLSEVSGATLLVLDCHGGPDHLSFAACGVADISILVSEPDKITFYGTMHFVRQLESVCPREIADRLYLVFNKVVPAFSVTYLTRFYDRTVREIFAGKPLLSIIPLEVYLTKEFEKTPFLTEVYPYSALARKMRLLGHDLFCATDPGILPKNMAAINRVDRMLTRLSLGKIPALLNVNLVMAVTTVAVLFFFVISLLESRVTPVLISLNHQVAYVEAIDRLQKDHPALDGACVSEVGSQAQVSCEAKTCPEYGSDPQSEACQKYARNLKLGLQTTGFFDVQRVELLEEADKVSHTDRYLHSPDEDLRRLTWDIRERCEHLNWVRVWVVLVNDRLSAISYLAYWFFIALLWNWSVSLDRRFTYETRRHRPGRAVMVAVAVLVVWSAYGFYYSIVQELWKVRPWLTVGGFIPPAVAVLSQLYKASVEIPKERRFTEGFLRLGFVAALVVQAALTVKFVDATP